MSKTYIIYYTWPNTARNHAGMAYLVKEIKKYCPEQIKLIEIPQSINKWPLKLQRLHLFLLALWLKLFLYKSGKVFFMEYLGGLSGNQTGLAIMLRKWGIMNKFIGLVHLSGNYLLEIYGEPDYIKEGAEVVDNILVFGSSLADFFNDLGYGDKLIKTFHYVDTNYYKPSTEPKPEKLQVIHIGSIKRDFKRLRGIVIACPEIDFHICQGLRDLSEHFVNLNNVKLYGFLSEDQLLRLMQSCHISLNILDDTVGSNVITTSMACGLVNVVSDVGSIRDYCDKSNSLIFKSDEDFICGLKEVDLNRDLLIKLREASIVRSNEMSLQKSIIFIQNLLNYK
jgi:glycosyltransferase involved in cell wall biosynthesis